MKVLITGANGQLGWELLRTAPPRWQVVGLDRQGLDITREEEVARLVVRHAPHWIVNTAAHTAVDEAEFQPDLARAVNVAGVVHLAMAARRVGARLLHLSTDYVFDGRQGRPWRPGDGVAPLGVYGRTKAAGEAALAELLPRHALVVRTAWLYSAHGKNFVHTMLRLLSQSQELRVVVDQIGSPTWAGDLARALWGLMAADARGVLHWTNGGVASWYDFAMVIRQQGLALGLLEQAAPVVPVPGSAYPRPAPRPGFSVLDGTATWEILGEPPRHWMAALGQMLQEVKG